jgi:hypothetical protein
VIREILEKNMGHHVCDDPWYSCPESEEGCADDRQSGCTCGRDSMVDELEKQILSWHNSELSRQKSECVRIVEGLKIQHPERVGAIHYSCASVAMDNINSKIDKAVKQIEQL